MTEDNGIYVITAPGAISLDNAKRIEDAFVAKYPNKKCLVLGDGLSIYRIETSESTKD